MDCRSRKNENILSPRDQTLQTSKAMVLMAFKDTFSVVQFYKEQDTNVYVSWLPPPLNKEIKCWRWLDRSRGSVLCCWCPAHVLCRLDSVFVGPRTLPLPVLLRTGTPWGVPLSSPGPAGRASDVSMRGRKGPLCPFRNSANICQGPTVSWALC